ncbi:MAG TPA: hypothetical protein VIK53_07230, partial [Verrucomicrobiae bacterium]
GKAHTFMIESLNNRIRCHLARLKRKTHRYTKSKANLAASILLLLVRQCGGEPVAQSLPIPVWQSLFFLFFNEKLAHKDRHVCNYTLLQNTVLEVS